MSDISTVVVSREQWSDEISWISTQVEENVYILYSQVEYRPGEPTTWIKVVDPDIYQVRLERSGTEGEYTNTLSIRPGPKVPVGSFTIIVSDTEIDFGEWTGSGTKFWLQVLYNVQTSKPVCYFSRFDKSGTGEAETYIESRLYLDNVVSLTDGFRVSISDIPMQVLPVRSRYLIDFGNTESISVTFSRTNPGYILDDSQDSRDWSNSHWVVEYRNFFDIWQNLTYDQYGERSGGFTFNYIPQDLKLQQQITKNVFINGDMGLSHKLGVVQGTISMTVASMLLKGAIREKTLDVYFKLNSAVNDDGEYSIRYSVAESVPYRVPDIPDHFQTVLDGTVAAGWSLADKNGNFVDESTIYTPGQRINLSDTISTTGGTQTIAEILWPDTAGTYTHGSFVYRVYSIPSGMSGGANALVLYREQTERRTFSYSESEWNNWANDPKVREFIHIYDYTKNEDNTYKSIDLSKNELEFEEYVQNTGFSLTAGWYQVIVVGAGGGPGSSDVDEPDGMDWLFFWLGDRVTVVIDEGIRVYLVKNTRVAGGGGSGEVYSRIFHIDTTSTLSDIVIGHGGKYNEDGEDTSVFISNVGTISADGGACGKDKAGGEKYVKGGLGRTVPEYVTYKERHVSKFGPDPFYPGSSDTKGESGAGTYWGAGGGAANLNLTLNLGGINRTFKSKGGTANGRREGSWDYWSANMTVGAFGGGAASHCLNGAQDWAEVTIRASPSYDYETEYKTGAGHGIIIIVGLDISPNQVDLSS